MGTALIAFLGTLAVVAGVSICLSRWRRRRARRTERILRRVLGDDDTRRRAF